MGKNKVDKAKAVPIDQIGSQVKKKQAEERAKKEVKK